MLPTQNLKTDPYVFQMSWEGYKPFELRYDDRNFSVGQEIVLYETEFSGSEMKAGKPLKYTGRRIRQRIISKITGLYGLDPFWCALGVEELHRENTPVTWEVKPESL